MEINEMKPNLERIEKLLEDQNYYYPYGNPFQEPEHPFFLWQYIEETKLQYEHKEFRKIKAILKEYQLEALQNDFLFLAFNFLVWIKHWKYWEESLHSTFRKKEELIYVLKFLHDYNESEIKIDFKHLQKNISTSIKNQILLNVIKKALLEHFIENDFWAIKGIKKPEEVKDYREYFGFLIAERESYIKKKGRKEKHLYTGRMIDSLQNYLQEYTDMKADENIPISRNQALFIYKFLDALDIFPEKLAWEEDNMRLILVKLRAKKRQK
jgi:hypothetical protein